MTPLYPPVIMNHTIIRNITLVFMLTITLRDITMCEQSTRFRQKLNSFTYTAKVVCIFVSMRFSLRVIPRTHACMVRCVKNTTMWLWFDYDHVDVEQAQRPSLIGWICARKQGSHAGAVHQRIALHTCTMNQIVDHSAAHAVI
jgi:hypothetical protein